MVTVVLNFSERYHQKKSSLIGFAGVQTRIDSMAAYHVGAKCPTKLRQREGPVAHPSISLVHEKNKF